MPVEHSAGIIIFRKEGGNFFYLLLHYPSSSKSSKEYWDFPKGHIKRGEDVLETARREASEETGLREINIIKGFKETIKYFFKFQGKIIFKTVIFYLAETKTRKVKISSEHMGYKWLPYKEALEQLTFKNAKDILKKANQFL